MIEVLKKIWRFAGKEQWNITKSVFWGFFYAVFHMFQVGAIYYVVLALTGGEQTADAAWTALLLLAASVIGRAVINRFTQLQQTHAGYFMVANRRIEIGDKLKRIPMGYFNEKSLGEITGVATTVLDVVETSGPVVLVSILSGLINALVFMLCVFAFDWRIGLLVLAGTLLYLWITSRMEQKSVQVTPRRQESEAQLVDAVLEQLQGMSVIKSFNLTGKGDRQLREALEYNRKSNLDIEQLFTPYNIAQEGIPPPVLRADDGSRRILFPEWDNGPSQCGHDGDHLLYGLLPDSVRRQRRSHPAGGRQLHRPCGPD